MTYVSPYLYRDLIDPYYVPSEVFDDSHASQLMEAKEYYEGEQYERADKMYRQIVERYKERKIDKALEVLDELRQCFDSTYDSTHTMSSTDVLMIRNSLDCYHDLLTRKKEEYES